MTRNELTGHNTDSAAHGNIRIPITRIVADMLDESSELSQQPVLNESTKKIDTYLLPDEIGGDVEDTPDGTPCFVGFRIMNDATQSTYANFAGIQVESGGDTVDIKTPGYIRIGGNCDSGDAYIQPAIELAMPAGVTTIRNSSAYVEDSLYIEIDELIIKIAIRKNR